MEVLNCLHAALLVSDLPRAQRFYEGVLGLAQADRAAALGFPGIWYQVGTLQLHLIVHPGWQAVAPNAEKWGRNPHLALAIADFAAVKAQLQAASIPLQMSASGRAALFVRDPDGNILELSQAPQPCR